MDLRFKIGPSGKAADETELKLDISDFHGYAVKAALQIKEKRNEGVVPTFSFANFLIGHLSWKSLLDGFACTECDRRTPVCPAHITGKLLSPRKIMVNVRERRGLRDPRPLRSRDSSAR